MKYENLQAFELVKLYFRIPHPLTSRLIQVGKCAFLFYSIAVSKIPASCKQQTAVAEALADCKQQAGL